MNEWSILRDLTQSLQTQLTYARGPDRIATAASIVRTARVALEPLSGAEVEAVRGLLAALEAAHREVGL
jgi:hypothetical protein